MFEWKGVDFGSNSLFYCLNGSFDHFGMFIFCCSVEGNLGLKGLVMERGKLTVCIDLADDEAALPIGSTDWEETRQKRFCFGIEEKLGCSILDLGGDGVEGAKTVDPEHIHLKDDVFVVFDDGFRYI